MATDDVKRVVCSYHPEITIADNAWCDKRVYCDDLMSDTYTVNIDCTRNPVRDIIESIIPIPTVSADRIRRAIKRVIYNDPATIVFWKDGTKTVARCGMNDTFDKEKGMMACIIKHLTGDTGRWNEILKKWVAYDESTPNKNDRQISNEEVEEYSAEEDEQILAEEVQEISDCEDESEDFESMENSCEYDTDRDDADDEPIDEDDEDDADEDS